MEMIENLPLPPRGEIGATTGTGYCWGGSWQELQVQITNGTLPEEDELILLLDIREEGGESFDIEHIPEAMGYIIRGHDVDRMDQFGFTVSQYHEGFVAFLPIGYNKPLVGEYLSFRYISNTILIL